QTEPAAAAAAPAADPLADSPLRDTFGRFHDYLRISLVEKCNLRCVYCMPAGGVTLSPKEQLLSYDERLRTLRLFSSLGVKKVKFTGGEPLVSRDLADLISFSRDHTSISNIGITTNALLLSSQLERLAGAGLSNINVSLDTLDADKFSRISRRDSKVAARVLSGLYAALAKGITVKINCVLMRGVNDDEMKDFIRMTRDVDMDVRFIELMPFDGNEWTADKMMTYYEAIDDLEKQVRAADRTAASKHDTAKWYRVPGHRGRVGFITSMTSHFCGGCNRLRITADGNLKVCLFGDDEYSLRDAMRAGLTDLEIAAQIAEAVSKKKFSLGGHKDAEELSKSKNRPMILIGG
ncbi:unnamed protein product, partial [Ectocarpus fasciculatus]